MKKMHRLLEEQLQRHFPDQKGFPKEMEAFLQEVSVVYARVEREQDHPSSLLLDSSEVVSTVLSAQGGAFWQRLLVSLPVAFVAVDLQGRIAGLSRGSLEESPLREGMSLLEFLRGQSEPLQQLALLLAGTRADFWFEHSGKTYEVLCHPSDLSSDGFGGFVGVLIDITERRQVQAQTELKERLASLSMLAAGVAHEINNPLACIIANLDFLHDEFQRLPVESVPQSTLHEVRTLVEEAREGASRVRSIVRGLVQFSRTEAREIEPVDVQQVMESTLSLAAQQIEARAQLHRHYSAVPLAMANRARLGQVFLNLLVNAMQSIPEGYADENIISISTWLDRDKGRVVLEIRDSGQGMAPEVLRNIFHPFFTTKPVGQNQGLGLALCHTIITGFGGDIAVESQPGKGSTFQIYLRINHNLNHSLGFWDGEDLGSSRAAQVLVIDDEHLVGRTLKRALQQHDVTFLSDAREGLAHLLAPEAWYDIIFCDLFMPELTGMELYNEVSRQRPELAHNFVFISGGAFTPRAQEFLSRIPNVCLEKPFDMQRVRALAGQSVSLWQKTCKDPKP